MKATSSVPNSGRAVPMRNIRTGPKRKTAKWLKTLIAWKLTQK